MKENEDRWVGILMLLGAFLFALLLYLFSSCQKQYKCHRQKFFDGNENNWEESEELTNSWSIDSSNLPQWLHNYL